MIGKPIHCTSLCLYKIKWNYYTYIRCIFACSPPPQQFYVPTNTGAEQCIIEIWFLPPVCFSAPASCFLDRCMPPTMRRLSATRRTALTGPPPPSAIPSKWRRSSHPTTRLSAPWGFAAGHDALIKTYASFLKPGDKEADTVTSERMIGDVALCTGGWTFTPASGAWDAKGAWTRVVGKVGGEYAFPTHEAETMRFVITSV